MSLAEGSRHCGKKLLSTFDSFIFLYSLLPSLGWEHVPVFVSLLRPGTWQWNYILSAFVLYFNCANTKKFNSINTRILQMKTFSRNVSLLQPSTQENLCLAVGERITLLFGMHVSAGGLWYMPISAVFRRQRQADGKFEASLDFTARPCLRRPKLGPGDDSESKLMLCKHESLGFDF